MSIKKIRFIAYYLPQFHPIKENSEWWGKGFTEWRNVAKAKPLFPGHQQPVIPGDLGFYDLRVDETRIEQAELAKEAGIEGFCYYNYYYSGRLLLEKPLELTLSSNKPDFPFCICWANHDWSMHWAGRSSELLVKQEYGDEDGITEHYNYLRQFFIDKRYIKIEKKPIFSVFKPGDIPNIEEYISVFNRLAIQDGFDGLYFIANSNDKTFLQKGFSALAPHVLNDTMGRYKSVKRSLIHKIQYRLLGYPQWVVRYTDFIKYTLNEECDGITIIPTVIPNWDNTPRVGKRGFVLKESTPELFKQHVQKSIKNLNFSDSRRNPIVFIKSWNEWAEGNYLEPDLTNGKKYLDVIQEINNNLNG
jgi:hypothetical protein